MTDALTDQIKYGSYLYNSMCFIPSEIAYGGSTLTANYVDVYMGAWGSLYGALRRTNEAIYNLHTLGTNLSEADRIRLEAELRLVRGWLYFELVKRYKEIIIYDEDLTAIVKDKAVSPEADGWKAVKDDLAFAEQNLPEKANARGRLDKGAAYALATRALLYAKDYAGVIAAADAVKSLGYSLESDYASVFAGGGTESILQYNFSYADNVMQSFDFYYSPGGDFARVASCWSLVSRRVSSITAPPGKDVPSNPTWADWTAGPSGGRKPSPWDGLRPAITFARAWMRTTILREGMPRRAPSLPSSSVMVKSF